jgi:hypothetical protein
MRARRSSRRRGIERFRRLVEAQATEEPAFDDLRLSRIELFEPGERLAQGNQFVERLLRGGVVVVDREHGDPAPTLGRAAPHRVVDQHVPHGPGRDGKEVSAAAPVDPLDREQLEVRLVNEIRRRQRMPAALTPEPYAGDSAELSVNTRQQLFERGSVARSMRLQQCRDFGIRRIRVRHLSAA